MKCTRIEYTESGKKNIFFLNFDILGENLNQK